MKTKFIFAVLCFTMITLLFSGCKVKDKGAGNQSCTHEFIEGVCETCGETDPNYTPGGSDDNNEQKPEEEEKEDNSKIPPIDFDGEIDLPFVPAT